MKKVLFISLAAVLALSMGLIGCTGPVEPTAPDYINILAIRSVTGPLSIFEQTAMGPIYKYWNHVIDGDGGIYVPEFDETIPVKIDVFDDNSDLATMQTLMEQKLATGNYNFVIGPDCTPFLEAAGPICSLYHSVLVGAEGGATAVAQQLGSYPYMFCNLSFADWYQVPELCKTMADWADTQGGNITAYVMYLNDQHGYEYRGEFDDVVAADYSDTIIILKEVAMTPYTEDVSAQVNEAHDTYDADVLLIFAYPPTPMAVVGYASVTGRNFNAIVTGPAACYEGFYSPTATPTGFGAAAIGVCGFGAWNEYSDSVLTGTSLHDFAAGLIAYSGRDLMDWWGGAYYYVGLDMLRAAISTATNYSALDVRNVMASQTLTTILGETYYTTYNGTSPIGTSGGLLAIACHPGEVGQWQRVTEANDWLPDDVTGTARTKPVGIAANATEWAIFEVISPDSKATAPWVYPKPDWPT